MNSKISHVCSVCKQPVSVGDTLIIRLCSHSDASIIANISATVYGISSIKK